MKKLAFIFVLSFVNTIFSQHTLKYIPQSRKDSLEILFLIKLNNYRKQNNLPSLSIDKIVTKAALEQAEYCATIGMQTHNNPNPNLTKKTFSSYAENAISGYIENPKKLDCLSNSILNDWIKSTLHNKNLLNPDMQYIGLSYAVNETGKMYVILTLYEY
jgi:uncharacterized protein YkwD